MNNLEIVKAHCEALIAWENSTPDNRPKLEEVTRTGDWIPSAANPGWTSYCLAISGRSYRLAPERKEPAPGHNPSGVTVDQIPSGWACLSKWQNDRLAAVRFPQEVWSSFVNVAEEWNGSEFVNLAPKRVNQARGTIIVPLGWSHPLLETPKPEPEDPGPAPAPRRPEIWIDPRVLPNEAEYIFWNPTRGVWMWSSHDPASSLWGPGGSQDDIPPEYAPPQWTRHWHHSILKLDRFALWKEAIRRQYPKATWVARRRNGKWYAFSEKPRCGSYSGSFSGVRYLQSIQEPPGQNHAFDLIEL